MMRSFFLLVNVVASLTMLPLSAHAALVCSAEMEALNFGEISVQDSLTLETSGETTVSCAGGCPHNMVQLELTIGSESGRLGLDGSPRYMTDDGAAQLLYTVTDINGGDSVGIEIQLDENGQATTKITLDAEIISPGSDVTAGSYNSDDLVELKFCEVELTGEAQCNSSPFSSIFTVEAIVTASCTFSVSNMDFGNIDSALVSSVDQIATISLSCTNATAYTIGLSQGVHFLDTGPTGRRMNNGGHLLAYGLYLDEARSESWGHDAGTVATGVGTGADQSRTVFGRITANQSAIAGTYTDTVVVIVTY
jgi:spore coat protein U-like protein